ncbi:MAG TPA: twin-arginine translocase subunit TatC [Mycobacteriales bacterium]|jgi:sec-independent protein translocase protein TatC|nr:twin-arginine translocase subunit TatC [Mycobacteriales bacterium]
MSLSDHLSELRHRLLISALAIITGTIVAFIFHTTLLHGLTHPYCSLPHSYRIVGSRCTLFVSGVLDPFTITLKLSLYAGLIVSSPVWLYQMWKFITPGLYSHEKRYAYVFVGASTFLFLLGGLFAWLTLEKGLRFLLGFATGGLTSLLSFNSYLSFVTAMILVFAVSFEFPLLVVMLNLVGVLPFQRLRRWTRGTLFGIFVFAAVATPSQDPFTMLALAVPMCVLFGLALLFAYFHDKRKARNEEPSLFEPVSDEEMAAMDDDELTIP